MRNGIHVSTRCFAAAIVILACVPTRLGWAAPSGAPDEPVATSSRPCRLVVPQPLREIVDDAWRRSATFRRQCRDLADARAVVVLTLRARFGRAAQADTAIGIDAAGIVVATVSVPLDGRTVELVAHELEHVVERVTGIDLAGESRRRDSGVWRASGGFETHRAIEAGRRVAREVREGATRHGRVRPAFESR
jgi:hypothetical protein